MKPWIPWVSLVARLVLGGVMLVAGALKVTDPETAAQAVRAYELLPSALVEPVGWGLPFLEIAIKHKQDKKQSNLKKSKTKKKKNNKPQLNI